MHACMLVSPAPGASGSTVRVEGERLPPLTLFALEDNQRLAQALELTKHKLGNHLDQHLHACRSMQPAGYSPYLGVRLGYAIPSSLTRLRHPETLLSV